MAASIKFVRPSRMNLHQQIHQPLTILHRACWLICGYLVWSMALTSSQLIACSVPVFRYALEHWNPDAYSVVVFHDTPLTNTQQAWVNQLDTLNSPSPSYTNLNVRTVNLSEETDDSLVALWKKHGTEITPSIMVFYPRNHISQGPFWTKPLNKETITQLTDSPTRREVARRLLKGESAVWVLMEIGDPIKDKKAHEELSQRLEYLSNHLELPDLNPADIEDKLITIEEEELKIAFSTLRLSRKDPKEAFFIQMLLGTEDDLKEFDEPIAFPIFGRGRALYALIGDGINSNVIDEACSFLTGACSCEVKEENPGTDLVLSVDWDRLITRHYDIDKELPELTGFISMDMSTEQDENFPIALTNEVANLTSPQKLDSKDAATTSETNRPIFVSMVIVCTIIGSGALLISFIMVRRNDRLS